MHPMKYVVIEKKVGETPLQALEAFRQTDPTLQDIPLTYAGRLDPMASGKLLILIGGECKYREKYDGLDKEYEFEILLGVTSDTGDVLGIPSMGESRLIKEHSENDLQKIVSSLIGWHTLPYPPFSSKTVAGKPLFQYALEGTLDSIEIPTIKTHVYTMEYLVKKTLTHKELIEQVLGKIHLLRAPVDSGKIGADFRKAEIIRQWEALSPQRDQKYTILKFKAVVSSGTYIRSLAPIIAEHLGTLGMAYSIHRTRIGKYQALIASVGFWKKTFI
ncbi:hypothetical protein EPO14_00615 [Patescibacteria group bacterium]|nr:MAG: hypothetical protein EPO14_00615 [Patescibacteria group bacterium]